MEQYTYQEGSITGTIFSVRLNKGEVVGMLSEDREVYVFVAERQWLGLVLEMFNRRVKVHGTIAKFKGDFSIPDHLTKVNNIEELEEKTNG